jgi:hypothetical protein
VAAQVRVCHLSTHPFFSFLTPAPLFHWLRQFVKRGVGSQIGRDKDGKDTSVAPAAKEGTKKDGAAKDAKDAAAADKPRRDAKPATTAAAAGDERERDSKGGDRTAPVVIMCPHAKVSMCNQSPGCYLLTPFYVCVFLVSSAGWQRHRRPRTRRQG